LMQAPKNGFFYVIDRKNGAFISAEPFVYTNWAKEIDYLNGRPTETHFSRYKGINARISPTPSGAHNWHPMAYNKYTGLVYIPAQENSSMYGQVKNWEFVDDGRSWNTGTGLDTLRPTHNDSLAEQRYGKLIAWDPIQQKEVWSVKHTAFGNGGVLATEELVFQGSGDGNFIIFDAESGEKLWSFPLNTGIVAPPITFEVDGIQYITVLAGWGGVMGLWEKYTKQNNSGGVYTFALGGKEEAPQFTDKGTRELVNIAFTASKEQIMHGNLLFTRYCGKCHGGDGAIPSLSYSRPEVFESFYQIVGEGLYLGKGMPNFKSRLSKEDILNVKNYILSDANDKREALKK